MIHKHCHRKASKYYFKTKAWVMILVLYPRQAYSFIFLNIRNPYLKDTLSTRMPNKFFMAQNFSSEQSKLLECVSLLCLSVVHEMFDIPECVPYSEWFGNQLIQIYFTSVLLKKLFVATINLSTYYSKILIYIIPQFVGLF